eukprot:4519333-Lingulodinium_polyedra.AAC.1
MWDADALDLADVDKDQSDAMKSLLLAIYSLCTPLGGVVGHEFEKLIFQHVSSYTVDGGAISRHVGGW